MPWCSHDYFLLAEAGNEAICAVSVTKGWIRGWKKGELGVVRRELTECSSRSCWNEEEKRGGHWKKGHVWIFVEEDRSLFAGFGGKAQLWHVWNGMSLIKLWLIIGLKLSKSAEHSSFIYFWWSIGQLFMSFSRSLINNTACLSMLTWHVK